MPLVIPFNKLRIVLDPASLITALRSNQGAAAEVLRLALAEKLITLMDYKLACEYREVASRPEQLAASGLSLDEVEKLIGRLESVAQPVEIVDRHLMLSQDTSDDMVLEVAINGHADAIITANMKHFCAPAEPFHIDVLTPRDLLERLRQRE